MVGGASPKMTTKQLVSWGFKRWDAYLLATYSEKLSVHAWAAATSYIPEPVLFKPPLGTKNTGTPELRKKDNIFWFSLELKS